MIVNNHFVPRKGQSPRVISSCSMKETHNTSWTTADSSEPPCANDHRCSALSVAVHPQIALKELWIATTGHWQASCANNDHCTATGCWILTSTAFATLTAAHLYYKHPPYAFIANRNNHNHPSHALKIHYAFSDTQSTPQEDRVQELLKTTPNAALWPSGALTRRNVESITLNTAGVLSGFQYLKPLIASSGDEEAFSPPSKLSKNILATNDFN